MSLSHRLGVREGSGLFPGCLCPVEASKCLLCVSEAMTEVQRDLQASLWLTGTIRPQGPPREEHSLDLVISQAGGWLEENLRDYPPCLQIVGQPTDPTRAWSAQDKGSSVALLSCLSVPANSGPRRDLAHLPLPSSTSAIGGYWPNSTVTFLCPHPTPTVDGPPFLGDLITDSKGQLQNLGHVLSLQREPFLRRLGMFVEVFTL